MVEFHDQVVLGLRVQFLRAVQADRADGPGAARSVDPDVAGVQPPRHVLEEVHAQAPTVVAYLHPVEPVAVTLAELASPLVARDHQIAPSHLAVHGPPGTDRVRLAGAAVASTV